MAEIKITDSPTLILANQLGQQHCNAIVMCAKRNKMYTPDFCIVCCGVAVSQSPNSMQPWYLENNLKRLK